MDLVVFQKGFNYAQDGRGNRLIYHIRGCNLHCPWCSNPEGMDFSETGRISAEELVEEAVRSKPLFFDGGGVTFTGGECTCRFDALKEALARLRERNIGTAIETNGTSPRLPEIFPLVDELIMDCKHYDSAIHREVTGLGNEQILANLAAAAKQHPDLLIRIPLIGGFNAGEDDGVHFVELFRAIGAQSARIELLLYHEYGKEKWRQLGKEYTVRDAFVSEETRKQLEKRLLDSGFQVVRT